MTNASCVMMRIWHEMVMAY